MSLAFGYERPLLMAHFSKSLTTPQSRKS